jgi:hypothetical protein
VAAATGLAATPAVGAQRYAAPGEVDTSPCTQVNPCSIDSAIENAVDTDEVIITQGTYSVTDILLVVPGTNVHGEAGAPRPRITSGEALTMGGNTGTGTTRVAHLKIENTTSGGGALAISGGLAEDIVAETTSAVHTCLVEQATLRDSTCWTSGSGGTAVDSTQPGVSNLRNVTAVAEGAGSSGIAISSFDPPGGQVVIDAKNVIADGFADVTATTDSVLGDSADVTLSYSNYVTESTAGSDATITPSDSVSAHNQEAAPQFVEASTGNFHQAPGSPTIDSGTTDVLLGSFDIDGEPRVQGPAPDIGADETANPQPPPPPPPPEVGPEGDTSPPDTLITKSPPAKSKSKSATFEFSSNETGSTFECKRDATNFESCSSPNSFKVGKGKHTFQVRATDAAGNTDPTPAADDWKVKPKRKK